MASRGKPGDAAVDAAHDQAPLRAVGCVVAAGPMAVGADGLRWSYPREACPARMWDTLHTGELDCQDGVAVETSFSNAIGQWRDFQSLVGAVGATLLGLLFVAVSIRPALFGRDTRPEFLSLALKSLGLFMLVVLIALLFLMPDPRPQDVGIGLLVMGGISLFNSMQQMLGLQRLLRREWGAFFVLRRVLLPTVGYLLLLVTSFRILEGDPSWIPAVGWLQMLFLFTATYNAWDLLTHVAKQ